MIFSNKKEGFTIIELLMTIIIFSWGIVAVVSFMLHTFRQSIPLSYEVTASYLTQEAFEVVRRIRDENYLIRYHEDEDVWNPDQVWHDGLLEEGEEEVVGSVYYGSEELGSRHGQYLCLDEDKGFFYYYTDCDEDEETTFKRKIQLELKEREFEPGTTEEYLLVTVEVSWEDRDEPIRTKTTQTKLYDWYE